LFYFSCSASCGSNISNYEIVESSGRYSVNANCSMYNVVLGCGIKPGRINVTRSPKAILHVKEVFPKEECPLENVIIAIKLKRL
jgi:hypothetical protein